jgi:hypothetical protein
MDNVALYKKYQAPAGVDAVKRSGNDGGEASDARRTKATLDAGSLLSTICPKENGSDRKRGAMFAQSVICFSASTGGWWSAPEINLV